MCRRLITSECTARVAMSDDAELTPVDRDALRRCVAQAMQDGDRAGQITEMLMERQWADVAKFCSYCCQAAVLELRTWEHPPCWGSSPDADALIDRLRQAGVSRFEPDPLGALKRAGKPPPPKQTGSKRPP